MDAQGGEKAMNNKVNKQRIVSKRFSATRILAIQLLLVMSLLGGCALGSTDSNVVHSGDAAGETSHNHAAQQAADDTGSLKVNDEQKESGHIAEPDPVHSNASDTDVPAASDETIDNPDNRTEKVSEPNVDGHSDTEQSGTGITGESEQSGAASSDSGTMPSSSPTNDDAPDQKTENTTEHQTTISIAAEGEIGVILEETEAEWKDGDTVLDVLKRVTREQKMQMEYRGFGALTYVEGIANVYEFDHGPASGWVYKVNGELVKKSAGAWKVKAGDRIEWIYVLKEESGESTE